MVKEGAVPGEGKRGVMSDERRRRLRLEISREAADLFWAQGVAATSGEQIAAAVGLSVRTVWRHFRSKESCLEPVLTMGFDWFVAVMRRWPPERSLAEHLVAEWSGLQRTPDELADDVRTAKIIVLGDREPAVRSAWLMACDGAERELAAIVAPRLGLPADDSEVRVHTAAICGALRVINEDLSVLLVDGNVDVDENPIHRIARTVRTVTSGMVGGPVDR